MNIIKRIISKALIGCLCISTVNMFNVLPSSAAEEELPNSLQNSGFELPEIKKEYEQQPDAAVPYWHTTAFEGKIELLRKNTGTYIPGYTLTPREGLQAAELNADEASSLYQNVKTIPGSFFKWGISHHGRNTGENTYDTMLLVIGPKQDIDPAKTAKDGSDQFMKMGDYISTHTELTGLIPTGNGASEEIVLYSPKFAASGCFKGFDKDNNAKPFSVKKTAVQTEEWHIWFIKSDSQSWHDYGTSETADTNELGYNNIYEVPEDQTKTTFAFTAYKSNKGNTYGNIIDNISFGLMHNVSIQTLAGGKATLQDEHGNILSVPHAGIDTDLDKFKDDSTATLTAIPDVGYALVGAVVNGNLIDHDSFTPSEDHTKYTTEVSVDGAKHIKFMFAKAAYLSYDPNGGTYQGKKGVTEKKYDYYTNGKSETEAPTPKNEGDTFTGWSLYTNKDMGTAAGITIPANHTVTYSAADHNNPTISIEWTDAAGKLKSVTLEATGDSSIILVANYSFKQEVIARTYGGGQGGIVDIVNSTRTQNVSGDDTDKFTAGEEGDIITVSAKAKIGYQFDGWFEMLDGSAVSKAREYSYVVAGGTTLYAKFSKKTVPEHNTPTYKSSYAYIYGYNDATMGPENYVLRGEVSAMLHRTVKQNNALGDFVYDKTAAPKFEDIGGRWDRSAIEFMTHKKAFDTSVPYVYPREAITRGEACKLVCLGLGFTEDETLTYEDYALILNASEINGTRIIVGYDDYNLGLGDKLLRAQFCTMFNRILGRAEA
ncbi:MAG: InlB B-repeat-containing protein, partial [Clostridiales bacterium]|nr:InlB B-repeat-containing protein [Clostridiales bacterium]